MTIRPITAGVGLPMSRVLASTLHHQPDGPRESLVAAKLVAAVADRVLDATLDLIPPPPDRAAREVARAERQAQKIIQEARRKEAAAEAAVREKQREAAALEDAIEDPQRPYFTASELYAMQQQAHRLNIHA